MASNLHVGLMVPINNTTMERELLGWLPRQPLRHRSDPPCISPINVVGASYVFRSRADSVWVYGIRHC